MNRQELINEAINRCIKELYIYVTPSVTWEDFEQQCMDYSNKYLEWEKEKRNDFQNHPEWKDVRIDKCIGPRPYEFYYLPKKIMDDICQSYVHTYKLNNQQELLDTIETLKNYCKEPIVDKYIEREGNSPGYRGYEHPDNLVKQLIDLIPDSGFDKSTIAESVQNKFFEFLDMAGKFFNWTRELNKFNINVYLGISPNSNKEKVIENWKQYKGVDITIDEKQIIKDYYGEED